MALLLLVLPPFLGVPNHTAGAEELNLTEFCQKLYIAIDEGDVETGIKMVTDHPLRASAYYRAMVKGYYEAQEEEVSQTFALLANFVARVFWARYHRTEWVEHLEDLEIRVEESAWAGTPLAQRQPTPEPLKEGLNTPWEVEEALLPFHFLRLAFHLGNYRLASELGYELQHKLTQFSKFKLDPESAAEVRQSLVLVDALLLVLDERLGHAQAVLDEAPPLLERFKALEMPPGVVEHYLIRTHLAVARAARRQGQSTQVEQALEKARGQLPGLINAQERVILEFTIETLGFDLALEQNPDVGHREQLEKHNRLWQELGDLPAGTQTNSAWLEGVRAVRLWFAIIGKGLADPRHEAAFRTALGADIALLEKLVTADATTLPAAKTSDLQRAEALVQQADAGATHLFLNQPELVLDLTMAMVQAGKYEEARKLIALAQQGLQETQPWVTDLDRRAEELFPGFEVPKFLPGSLIDQTNGRVAQLSGELTLATEPERVKAARLELEAAISHYQASSSPLLAYEVEPTLGRAMRSMGQPEAALELLERTERDCEKLGLRLLASEAGIEKALALVDLKNTEPALAALQKAIALAESYIEDLGGAWNAGDRVRERLNSGYHLLGKLQVEQGRYQEALATLTRERQVDTLTEVGSKLTPADRELRAKLDQLRNSQRRTRALEIEVHSLRQRSQPEKLKRAEQALSRSRAEFLSRAQELQRLEPRLYRSTLSLERSEFKSLQSAIPAGTAVVQYFPTEDNLYIFVVTAQQFQLRASPISRESLRLQVLKTVRELKSPQSAGFDWNAPAGQGLQQQLHQLHQILLAPLAQELAGIDTLALLPTAELHQLPFSCLVSAMGSPPQFVCDRYQTVVFSKATDLGHLAQAPRRGQHLIALGDPRKNLPSAAREARKLGELFQGSNVFLGETATEETLKTAVAGANMVHLATHGRLERDNSYLELAGDQRLSLAEITELPLQNAHLVTLSACETAAGAETSTSLAEAFWASGPASVVASLWRVDDESTERLMVEFYSHLKSQQGKAAAFRAGQQKLKSEPKTQHPYYWAPFVLMGDWR